MKKFTHIEEYPDILRPGDLIDILGVGRNTVYSYLAAGSIKSKKIGTKYIIPKKFLLDFIYDNQEVS